MIKQRGVTYKTAAASLSYSEIGDIIVNSEDDADITLPVPATGLWYRISNVGSGEVTVKYDSSTITTLKETEQALLLVFSSAWYMSKGAGAMTKAEIEAVLTGEISSHSHAAPSLDFLDLGDVPESFTDQAGKLLVVNEAEDALEFSDVPPAENGIPAGGTTNQLFAKNSNADYDGKWVDAPEAANGLPSGGTTGQILIKDSEDDFDTSWGDVDAVKIKTKPVNISDFEGKDGYILAYNESEGEFYLKADEGGGGFVLGILAMIAPSFTSLNIVSTSSIPWA